MYLDPKNALAAFRASCWTNTQLIRDFVTGRTNFALSYDEAKELDEMVDILKDQMEGMEETWDSVLDNVRIYFIHTKKNRLFQELSKMVVFTRRIVDRGILHSTNGQQKPTLERGHRCGHQQHPRRHHRQRHH